jgi:hypothetical protein
MYIIRGNLETQIGAQAKITTHAAVVTGIHGVGVSSVESDVGAASKITNHAAQTTNVHGAGASTIETIAGSQTKVDGHKDLATGVHGAGASTLETILGAQTKVDGHKDITTNVHGAGASTLETASGAQTKVNAHADGNVTTAIHPNALTGTQGTYTGNGSTNRAIPHGLGRIPKLVVANMTNAAETGSAALIATCAPTMWTQGGYATPEIVTAADATNFYVSALIGNANTYHYKWSAL